MILTWCIKRGTNFKLQRLSNPARKRKITSKGSGGMQFQFQNFWQTDISTIWKGGIWAITFPCTTGRSCKIPPIKTRPLSPTPTFNLPSWLLLSSTTCREFSLITNWFTCYFSCIIFVSKLFNNCFALSLFLLKSRDIVKFNILIIKYELIMPNKYIKRYLYKDETLLSLEICF